MDRNEGALFVSAIAIGEIAIGEIARCVAPEARRNPAAQVAPDG